MIDEDVKIIQLEHCSSGEQDIFISLVSELDCGSKTDTAVLDKMAKLLSNICSQKLSVNNLKDELEKYQRPGSILLLQSTKVNKLIWDNLRLPIRTTDLKLQKFQVINVKAMTALTSLLIDTLIGKAGIDKDNLLTKLADALALLGSANIDLNHYRRVCIYIPNNAHKKEKD